jgi:D-glycero-alpha-D-manno-heptose-7-phosphate kinase
VRSLVARAPTRIDFGGGWTDVPPYCEQEGGRVCNVALAHRSTVRIRRAVGDARPGVEGQQGDDGELARAALRRAGISNVILELRNDFPVGAGLGGSSAAGVAIAGALAAWRGVAIDRSAIAEESRSVECEDLGIAGGRQDHYAAAYGGCLELTFGHDTDVRAIACSRETHDALERRCIVAYTGESRVSGSTITAVLDAWRAGNARVVDGLARMKALAHSMALAIEAGHLDDLGAMVDEHWAFQRELHPSIPTPLIDEVIARARAAGALGGKALGASGGGSVLLVAADDTVEPVRREVAALAEILPTRLDESGLTWMAEE